MTRTPLLLSLLVCAASSAQQAPRRVAVLPFQELSGEVPGRAGPRVTQRLTTEVRAAEGLALAEPADTEQPPEPIPEPLAQARQAVKEAEARRQRRDFSGAEASLRQALDTYATLGGALPEGRELADVQALRAAVLYAQGKDEEAARVLASALSLAPGRALPLASTSPLFARTVEQVRASVQQQPRGTVRFVSVPPGVPVLLDGQPVQSAPVRVTAVPPGGHLWRAVLPSGEATGGLVEAVSGKEVEVKVRPPGEGPAAVLSSALAGNRLDAAAVEAATTLAQALKADLVVFGAVSRSETGLAVDAFVAAPGSKALHRVPRMTLDADLLDAGPPLRALTAALASRGAQAGEPVSLPVAPAPKASPAPRAAEVKYPLEAQPESAPKPAAPVPDRAPLAPRKPLVRP